MKLILTTLMVLFPLSAIAHQASDSYLWLEAEGANVSGRWDVAITDLEMLIGIDADGDGEITWGEVSDRGDAIANTLLSQLTIGVDGRECALSSGSLQIAPHAGSNYVSVVLAAQCPQAVAAPVVSYNLLFAVDPGHRGLMRFEHDGQQVATVFTPGSREWTWPASEQASVAATLLTFIVEGIWHIWIGYDHVAFLVLLLLPAVLRRREGQWLPAQRLTDIAVDTTKIVTAFTLAHSVTLAAAALGWVNPPMGIVEASIALSVVLAGLHNIFPVRVGPRWLLAFVFGLVHGFGFANVLGELGAGATLVTELIGFNLGVEIGQLAIAAVVLPLIYALRNVVFYRRVLVPAVSVATALVATHWLLDRTIL
ncbi:MAG: HupE/UreJ family protein [Gammaproteobacteria bacterium]|nr:HupE/UreJ family protein [Gammaproteobacteria bacterium]